MASNGRFVRGAKSVSIAPLSQRFRDMVGLIYSQHMFDSIVLKCMGNTYTIDIDRSVIVLFLRLGYPFVFGHFKRRVAVDPDIASVLIKVHDRAVSAVKTFILTHQAFGWKAPRMFCDLLNIMVNPDGIDGDYLLNLWTEVRRCIEYVVVSQDPFAYQLVGRYALCMAGPLSVKSDNFDTSEGLVTPLFPGHGFFGPLVTMFADVGLAEIATGQTDLVPTSVAWNYPCYMTRFETVRVAGILRNVLMRVSKMSLLEIIGYHDGNPRLERLVDAYCSALRQSSGRLDVALLPYDQSFCRRHHVPYPMRLSDVQLFYEGVALPEHGEGADWEGLRLNFYPVESIEAAFQSSLNLSEKSASVGEHEAVTREACLIVEYKGGSSNTYSVACCTCCGSSSVLYEGLSYCGC